MRQVLIALCALMSLTACSSQAPVQSGVTLPLRIEAKKHEGKYELFLNNEASPTTIAALKVALKEYAAVVDASSGMKGHDRYDYNSENPVIFHAPPDAAAELYLEVLECLVYAFIAKVWIELRRDGLTPLQCVVELPRDGSSSIPPNEREHLNVQVHTNNGVAEFSTGLTGRTKSTLHEADLDFNGDADAWENAKYLVRRTALTTAMIQACGTTRLFLAQVSWRRFDDPLLWGVLFQALDAVSEVNTARRRTGRQLLEVDAWAIAEPAPAEEVAPKPFEKDD